MARVLGMVEKEPALTRIHEAVEASYFAFVKDGQTYLQIDTYGSPNRKISGKVSQSIQFGPEAIALLRDVIGKLG